MVCPSLGRNALWSLIVAIAAIDEENNYRDVYCTRCITFGNLQIHRKPALYLRGADSIPTLGDGPERSSRVSSRSFMRHLRPTNSPEDDSEKRLLYDGS